MRNQMTDYYHTHFSTYHEKTFYTDPEPFLAPFAKTIAKGCSILDVGCGSGRDLCWLKSREFKVSGFERSPGLAGLARKNAGCRVVEGDFETFAFSTFSVDAIICIGSLVHLPPPDLPMVIAHISAGLSSPESMLFITLKQGTGTTDDTLGRRFFLWQDRDIENLINKMKFKLCDITHTTSEIGTKWLGVSVQNPGLKRNGTAR